MKIAIIGGGASGLTCAITAARSAKEKGEKAEITVYEANDRVGRKILATGNGRCNMMNENENVRYFGDNDFTRNALAKFDVKSNLEFFASMGLYTRSDEEGRIYPLSNQASGVLDALRLECERLGVKTVCGSQITRIKKVGTVFESDCFKADKVVLALGSKASVKGFKGYDLLHNLGHNVIKPRPSLTKLVVADNKYVKQLKGIRHKCDLALFIGGKKMSEVSGELLFTDYGLSGIAVMQLSAYVTRCVGSDIKVCCDMIPNFEYKEVSDLIKKIVSHDRKMKCENLLSGFMPKKIGEVIIKNCGLSVSDEVGTLTENDIDKIAEKAKNLPFEIKDVKGFEEAQVVSGGADTREFDSNTLRSKKVKGLYCCGELLNVDGLCGGYNLHWAWSSGRLCGESLIKK